MVTIDIDSSLLWQIANFLLLLVLLNYVLYRPIRGIIRQRAEKMAQLKGDIQASEEGAKSKTSELEAQRMEARRSGAEAAEELKNQGKAKERELVEAATAEMEETVAKIREEISREITQAREDLKAQIQNFGVDLAQKILGRSVQ